MLSQYKTRTNIGVGLGILTIPFGKFFMYSPNNAVVLCGLALWIAGVVLLIWGCGQYAKGKGFSQWWGILGLLYILGFLILFFFPDRNKAAASAP